MKAEPKVLILIVTLNRRKDLLECLDSLIKLKYSNFNILVISDGSSDETVEAVRAQWPNIKLIEFKSNQGIPQARNAGMRYFLEEGSQYLFIVDDDMILEPVVLKRLVQGAQSEKRIGMCTPTIVYSQNPQTIFFGRGSFGFLKGFENHYRGDPITNLPSTPSESDYAPTPSLLIKRRVIEEIGLFDVSFTYGSDLDYSLRARKAGFKIMWIPTVKVRHKGYSLPDESEVINEAKFYWLWRQLLRIHRKYFGVWRYPLSFLLLSRKALWQFADLKEAGDTARAAAVLSSLWDAILFRTGPPFDRAPGWFISVATKYVNFRRRLKK